MKEYTIKECEEIINTLENIHSCTPKDYMYYICAEENYEKIKNMNEAIKILKERERRLRINEH